MSPAPLKVTGYHKLWSISAGCWVSTECLKAGDWLMTLQGPTQVVRLTHVPGIHRVFNFEVENEHCYYAGTAQVLGHNLDCIGDHVNRPNTASGGAGGEVTWTPKAASPAAAKTGDSYVYGVIDTQTGTLTKPGMSSGPIPNRMNQSVKTADQRGGVPGQHKGVIIERGMTAEQARALEQKLTDKVEVRRPGTFPNKFHQRPTPKVETKEQFKDKYGHEHNQ